MGFEGREEDAEGSVGSEGVERVEEGRGRLRPLEVVEREREEDILVGTKG